MLNNTLSQEENQKKQVFIAKYRASNDNLSQYLFIYSAEESQQTSRRYNHHREKDLQKSLECLKRKFPEGVEFVLAPKEVLARFLNDGGLEQMSAEEFQALKPMLEAG